MQKKSEIVLNRSCTRVFNYMLDFGSITTIEACNDLGETRLSARISELKKAGVKISFTWIQIENRYKEKRHVKRYYLG